MLGILMMGMVMGCDPEDTTENDPFEGRTVSHVVRGEYQRFIEYNDSRDDIYSNVWLIFSEDTVKIIVLDITFSGETQSSLLSSIDNYESKILRTSTTRVYTEGNDLFQVNNKNSTKVGTFSVNGNLTSLGIIDGIYFDFEDSNQPAEGVFHKID